MPNMNLVSINPQKSTAKKKKIYERRYILGMILLPSCENQLLGNDVCQSWHKHLGLPLHMN